MFRTEEEKQGNGIKKHKRKSDKTGVKHVDKEGKMWSSMKENKNKFDSLHHLQERRRSSSVPNVQENKKNHSMLNLAIIKLKINTGSEKTEN